MSPGETPESPEIQMVVMIVRNGDKIDGGKFRKWNSGFLESGEEIRNREGVDGIGEDAEAVQFDQDRRMIDKRHAGYEQCRCRSKSVALCLSIT